jgi:glucose-1-phosphate adenylyltransferase
VKKTIAMILAGGRVDELSVLTLFRPKSSLPFGGLYRVIDFPLSNLMHSGVEKVGVLSQYRSDSLMNHIGSGTSWDMMGSQRGIHLLPPMKGTASSDWYKGTADAVYQNKEFIFRNQPDYVIVLSGDHVYKMDYGKMIAFHQAMKADVTVAFVKPMSTGMERFGQGVIEEGHEQGGRLLRYVEKPNHSISDWASMTIYLFSTDALRFVMDEMMRPPATEHFGRDILPVLLDKKRVFGYKFQGAWAYSRTIDEYWAANMSLLDENSPLNIDQWLVRTNLDNERVRDRAPAIIGAHASIRQSRVNHGCVIEGTVIHSILFPGVRVAAGCVVEDSILFYNTRVAKNVRLQKVITDVDVCIDENAVIGGGRLQGSNKEYPDLLNSGTTIIGRNTTIPAAAQIGCNCIIYPNKNDQDFSGRIMASGRTLK